MIHSSLAFTAIIFAHCSDYIFGAIYHYNYPAWVVVGTLSTYGMVFVSVAFVIHRYCFPRGILLVCDVLGLLLGFCLVLIWLRRLQLVDGALPLALKIALVIGSMGLAGLFVLRASLEARKNIRNALVLSSLCFMLSPPLVAAVSAKQIVFPIHEGEALHSPHFKNVVIVLLDELGDGAIGPIIDGLQRQNLAVSSRRMTPVGKHTADVIPRMLTGLEFPQASPCSSSAICSGKNILDFSRMQSRESKLDIVGFHHPYCKIQGLRYCYQALSPSMENPIIWFGCALTSVLVRVEFRFCKSRILTIPQVRAIRLDMVKAMDAAPFWREGGVFYVHVLLPHPPGHNEYRTLDEDYSDNIKEASELISGIANRLREQFQNDFLLLITSDHPLRLSVWCGMPRYEAGKCEPRPEFTSDFVPIIAASAVSTRVLDESNGDVFDVANNYRYGSKVH